MLYLQEPKCKSKSKCKCKSTIDETSLSTLSCCVFDTNNLSDLESNKSEHPEPMTLLFTDLESKLNDIKDEKK